MITRQHLPALSQLIIVVFDLKESCDLKGRCVELSRNKTQRLPGAPLLLFKGAKYIAVSRKPWSTFWQKNEKKKVEKMEPKVACRRERCESRVKMSRQKIDKLRWKNRIFGRSS